MNDELPKVIPRLFYARGEDDCLLEPVRELQQVVDLEQARGVDNRKRRPHGLGFVPCNASQAPDQCIVSFPLAGNDLHQIGKSRIIYTPNEPKKPKYAIA